MLLYHMKRKSNMAAEVNLDAVFLHERPHIVDQLLRGAWP